MPELTITSPYVYSNMCTMGNPLLESTLTYARVDFIPQSGAKNLAYGILETFHAWAGFGATVGLPHQSPNS
jgi:hypothetical protein